MRRFILRCWVCAALLGGGAFAAEEPAAPVEIDARRQLFVDDVLVDEMAGLRRTLHEPVDHAKSPVLLPEHPWEHRRIVYGSVRYFAAEQKFKCWYMTANLYDSRPGGRGYRRQHHVPLHEASSICYAESADGVHWKKPKLGLCEFRGSTDNNIVLTCPGSHFDGPSVMLTPHDKERPYKLVSFIGRWPYDPELIKRQWGEEFKFGVDVHAHYAWSSPDGLRWTPMNDGRHVLRAHDRSMFWYDPVRRIYVASAKGSYQGKRAHRYAWSEDCVNWKRPGDWLMTADQHDDPLDEAEAAYGFAYGAQWLGFVELRRMRFSPPKINWELMTSRDGRHWNRPIREPFLPDGRPDGWRYRNVKIIANPPIAWGDKLLIYYSGKTGSNDPFTGTGPNQALCLATLRRDGFVSLDGGEQPGRLVTKPVVLKGRQLHINADARGGEIRAALQTPQGESIEGFTLADCRPVSGDAVDAIVDWDKALPRQPVIIVFLIKRAELYALWAE